MCFPDTSYTKYQPFLLILPFRPSLPTNSIPDSPVLISRFTSASPSPFSSPLSKPPLGRSSPSFSRLTLDLPSSRDTPPGGERSPPVRGKSPPAFSSSSRPSPPRPLSSLSHCGSGGGGGVQSNPSTPGASSQAWWYLMALSTCFSGVIFPLDS